MPHLSNMARDELSVWYIENVGDNIGAEDPSMTLDNYGNNTMPAEPIDLIQRVVTLSQHDVSGFADRAYG
jgi:hypothetical protein